MPILIKAVDGDGGGDVMMMSMMIMMTMMSPGCLPGLIWDKSDGEQIQSHIRTVDNPQTPLPQASPPRQPVLNTPYKCNRHPFPYLLSPITSGQ